MSTITITTTSKNTISREELRETILRLPTGGDTHTEVIDDETGEVLYTCQNGQVQIAIETLIAMLTKVQGVIPTQELNASTIYDRWRIGEKGRLLNTDSDNFRAGDIVTVNQLDPSDDEFPIRIMSNDEHHSFERWIPESDIVHING